MQISYRGDYALKAILELARHYQKEPVTTREIAARNNLPEKFLEQVLSQLKQAGYIRSVRGARGGYQLNRPPERITMGEIIRLVDGPIGPIACVEDSFHVPCEDERVCALRQVFGRAREAMLDVVDNVNFADLISKQPTSPR